jgi:hypothetical protein
VGEMLKQTERAKGELKRGPVVTERNHGEPPTLAELGLTERGELMAKIISLVDRLEARGWVRPEGRHYASQEAPGDTIPEEEREIGPSTPSYGWTIPPRRSRTRTLRPSSSGGWTHDPTSVPK